MIRIELEPLAPEDALRITKLATAQHPLPLHVLEVVAQRSGGNPQFLRDLLRSAMQSGGIGGLPDSAEAAAMARIDALAPEDRALVRRAAVFGTDVPSADAGVVRRRETTARRRTRQRGPGCRSSSTTEPDGYLRFRRSLLRDAAYEGLPYKLRRRLHGAVAARLEEEIDNPEDSAGILSLHYFVAGEYRSGVALRHRRRQARRGRLRLRRSRAAVLARAGGRAPARRCRRPASSPPCTRRWAMRGTGRASSARRPRPTRQHARLVAGDPLVEAGLLLKRSRIEEKLGKYPQALRWAARARKALEGLPGPEAARQTARSSAWYATLLQAEGRSTDAMRWAERRRSPRPRPPTTPMRSAPRTS